MGPKMRMTQVSSIEDLSPHMRRIVLSGESLADFPAGKESAHVKVVFPNPESKDKRPKLGIYFGFKKFMRSYTVRYFDQANLTLTLDFAINDHQGLASNWAAQARVGEYLGIAGSGDIKHTDFHAERHLLFGDLTALPAIAATLEKLPKNATGKAWIQVPDKQDIQPLKSPNGIDIRWLVTENKMTNEFLDALTSQPTDLTNTAIFMAVEAGVLKQLKQHLNKHCEYQKSKLYASAYWNNKKKV
ncbi:siderophore-interacting protein [Paraglaciecola aquimarina]|uniref:Siderophore-interacting protein n=1 Tax=Paraglaciecola algarum TaxID=3050085 RepID=A0ABS9DAP6_9ALTE|nr:siderophore-interacting protein [Paraglaciecola sp. G1-23]MCF2949455.1 siderophore-interacting protein [Paraglaciecola sp. G1-23]